ncbi:MAG: hypothetical protein CO150_08365 [Nitrospirae bacterium CG_4_9_14_3_um_filter_53_35]|nr:MAG: hypothetical protein AUJ12_02395 [Alphaproteobacteria bacterium CG1_02_46_17]PIS36874.1 MAG: hypothetical protein COT35_08895 [Nitrospirae bacterium CG08_land_8_20_14_0_20_52_24]PIV82994.1 MAG: hypothetical protein COW52_10615 [Nitrospirae bacterium CG17_big_fil_post_rev_8_21_14_2_50_50_9]PIW84344.1 MAG: hypothetical protein COZ95_10300 [Nitrospirae bacterium CG_4_8_14_3_um_filter_50_41]PIX85434.1 MAG: hypothetical protein COZ32_08525 [Nitrospirae bacterium CG_4_10_14_3_um_filter_53_41]
MNSSALEHSVPEQLFSTPENPVQGVSAVKALAIANSQGIPIYQINKTNINAILPNLQLDGYTVSDIRNAVNAGLEVTVQQRESNFQGRMVAGYLIIDPSTGAGAYMISGGSNGAILILGITLAILLVLVALAPAGGILFLGSLEIVVQSTLLELLVTAVLPTVVIVFGVFYTTSDPFYEWIHENWEEYIEPFLVDIVDSLQGVSPLLKALIRILTGNP